MTGADAVTWSKTQSRARSDVTALALRRRSAEVGSTPLVTPLKAAAAVARDSTATQRIDYAIVGTSLYLSPRRRNDTASSFTKLTETGLGARWQCDVY